MDAASILSKHDQLPEDISIKPDMTKQLQEQQIEAILLKEDGPYRNKKFQRKTSKLGLLFCMSVDKNMQKWWIEARLIKLSALPQIDAATPVCNNTDAQSLPAMDTSSNNLSSNDAI